jgi:ABC-2 type transport system permease protein
MMRDLRLRGLIRKEFLQIVRDPSSIGIAFLMPLFLLLLFGYGISLDAENVPIAIVVEQPSADTTQLTGMFEQSAYFVPHHYREMQAAETALLAHEVEAIVRLRADFAQQLQAPGAAPIQLILNGVDANTARLVQGYVEGVWAGWLERRRAEAGLDAAAPIDIEQRIWFNADVASRKYLVPGLIAVIMTLIGALLTALVMAREWERGTMEALMVTPVAMIEILVGKLLPYFILGMGGMTLSVAMAVWLFQVPLEGSSVVLFSSAALFLLAALSMGLAISSIARNQFVAGLIAIVTTFLPAFIMSGFIFDIDSMPAAVQVITYIVAARYFVAIAQTVFLAGNIWTVILPNALALILMSTLFLSVVWRRTAKSLE